MSNNGVDVTAYEPDRLVGDHPAVPMPITLVSGEDLKRGHVLGKITASGKYTGFDADLSTGAETAVAILVDDTDATDGDVSAMAYMHGGFQVAGLLWDDIDNDKTTGTAQLIASGLYCK